MTEYNKLVRDKIPEIIRAGGETPYIRILDDAEFRLYLEAKLDEEVAEFHKEQNLEELLTRYQVKHGARGGFQDRIYLISKE